MDRTGGGLRVRGAWVVLFAQAVGLLALLALAELALWALDVQPLRADRDPFLGFSRRVRVFEPRVERGVWATRPPAVKHSFNHQEFRLRKPAHGFRVFVIGGSSAYGFPWGAQVAFPRVLGDALQAAWPQRTVESVNAAGMSYGSHRLRILVHELLDYEPDALVVFEAHNEFVETRFHEELLRRDERFDGLRQLVHGWRFYALASRIGERLRGDRGQATPPETFALLGVDVMRRQATGRTPAAKEEVAARFEENLRAIVAEARGRCAVVLCTVPSNLRGWRPNQSLFDTALSPAQQKGTLRLVDEARRLAAAGRPQAAAETLQAAGSQAPGYAEIHFESGLAYEALGRWEDAARAYRRARDLDAAPSRALGALNDAIRRVAAETGVILVDVERALERAAPHGLVGFELIEDYVHPNPRAHRLIALELWRAFQEHGLAGPARPPRDADFWSAVGEAPAGARAAGGAPAAAMLYNTAVVLEHQGLRAQAIEKYHLCLELSPAYHAARYNLARLLNLDGRPAQAVVEFERALAAEPDYAPSLRGLGIALVKLGRHVDAERVLRRAAQLEPGSVATWSFLGHALEGQGRLAEAVAAFSRAVELDGEDHFSLANLGNALRRQGRTREAEERLRASLALEPDHAPARDGLRALLRASGRAQEAERLSR